MTYLQTMLKKAFGEALQELRKERGLSQEKLAEYTNVDRVYISFLENGKRSPSLKMIFAVSSILEIDASELIRRMESKI